MSGIRMFASLLVVGWFVLPVEAQDPAHTPYSIRLVVHVERHRVLTDIFKQQVRRVLADTLQGVLGELARVEITDTHPRLLDIRSRGLARSLAGYRQRTGALEYFVLISFSGTHYEIQTHGYDGNLALPLSVSRSDRTRDRELVAQRAALLIERDLALVGTITTEPDAQRKVEVQLQGGALGVDLSRWVRPGEVFGVVSVDSEGTGQWLPFTVVQVNEPVREGRFVGRFFSRYRQSRVAGLRCVLLGTRSGSVRLRLMEESPGGSTRLRTPVTLQFRRTGFEGEDSTRLVLNPQLGRDVDTARAGDKGIFDRLVFVSVLAGERMKARVPIPILDDGLNVLVLPAERDSEEDDLALERFRSLQVNLGNAAEVQNNQFREINELSARPDQRAQTLDRVQATLQRLREDYQRLASEVTEIARDLERLPPAKRPSLDIERKKLERLKSGEAELLDHITRLEKIEKEENDPVRKQWLQDRERADLLMKNGEIEQALALYQKAPAAEQTPEFKQKLENLRKRWQPVNAAHAEARQFIYETWPSLNTANLAARIPEAMQAFAVCRAAGDVYGPNRLLRETEKHVQRIQKELNQLRPDVNGDDQAKAQAIQELLPQLRKLDSELRAYLEKTADK